MTFLISFTFSLGICVFHLSLKHISVFSILTWTVCVSSLTLTANTCTLSCHSSNPINRICQGTTCFTWSSEYPKWHSKDPTPFPKPFEGSIPTFLSPWALMAQSLYSASQGQELFDGECGQGLLCWVEQERERREAEFHFIYSILSQQSHSFYQNKHNWITSTSLCLSQNTTCALPYESSRSNTPIQVKGPAYMQSTTTIRVEGATICALPSQHLYIVYTYIMHMSWGACYTQPTQALLPFPTISSQIFAIKPSKLHKKHDIDKLWHFHPLPLTPWDSEPTPPL